MFYFTYKEKGHPLGNCDSKRSRLERSDGSCEENLCGKWYSCQELFCHVLIKFCSVCNHIYDVRINSYLSSTGHFNSIFKFRWQLVFSPSLFYRRLKEIFISMSVAPLGLIFFHLIKIEKECWSKILFLEKRKQKTRKINRSAILGCRRHWSHLSEVVIHLLVESL